MCGIFAEVCLPSGSDLKLLINLVREFDEMKGAIAKVQALPAQYKDFEEQEISEDFPTVRAAKQAAVTVKHLVDGLGEQRMDDELHAKVKSVLTDAAIADHRVTSLILDAFNDVHDEAVLKARALLDQGVDGHPWSEGLSPTASWTAFCKHAEEKLLPMSCKDLETSQNAVSAAFDRMKKIYDMFDKSLPAGWQASEDKLHSELLVAITTFHLTKLLTDRDATKNRVELRRAVLERMAKLLKKGDDDELAKALPAALRTKVDAAIKMKPV